MVKKSARNRDTELKGSERKVPSKFTFSAKPGKSKGENAHLTKSKKKKMK